MKIIKIFKMVYGLLQRIRKKIHMQQYDDFSIEDHFRALGGRIGTGNRIMIRNFGEAPSMIKIGNHCTITNDVMLLTHDGGSWIFNDEIPGLQKFGRIIIEDNCFIGVRSIILPNIRIGPNSVVGAGSVVTKDVPPNTVVGGNPAREICSVQTYREKLVKLWESQKPANYLSTIDQCKSPKEIEALKRKEIKALYEHLDVLLWKDEEK